jgi:ATP-dependent Clp protease protease subunit
MTAIYDTMRYVNADIQTVCLGQAGSAAALLLAAGTRGKRAMPPNARVVIHQPALEVSQAQTSDLEIQAREVTRLRALMERLLTRHTGRSRDQVRADIDRDTILGGPEALAYGLVDDLIPARKRRQLAGAHRRPT